MIKMKKLIIIGAASNAKLAAYFFDRDTEYQVYAFCVDKEFLNNREYCSKPVVSLESIEKKYPPKEFSAFVAVGYNNMNSIREKLYHKVKNLGYNLPNYISPYCSFFTENKIGDNNLILEDNTIQPFVKIGSNNVLWSGNHIGHDVEIGNNNFITSHVVISGFTKIENNTFIGVNATIRDNIKIRNKTLISAGAIIMKDTKEDQVLLSSISQVYSKKSSEIKIS